MPENGSGWQQGTRETTRVWTQARCRKRAAAQALGLARKSLSSGAGLSSGGLDCGPLRSYMEAAGRAAHQPGQETGRGQGSGPAPTARHGAATSSAAAKSAHRTPAPFTGGTSPTPTLRGRRGPQPRPPSSNVLFRACTVSGPRRMRRAGPPPRPGRCLPCGSGRRGWTGRHGAHPYSGWHALALPQRLTAGPTTRLRL